MAWFYSFLFSLLILLSIVHVHARYAEVPAFDPTQTTTIEKRLH